MPMPSSVTAASTAPFVFGAATKIIADGSAEVVRSAEFLARILRKSTAFALPVSRLQAVRNATGTGIVYASTVKQVETLYELLNGSPGGVSKYHGRMSAAQRTGIPRTNRSTPKYKRSRNANGSPR